MTVILDARLFADDYRVRALMRAPLIVGCKRCHAARGDDCVNSWGRLAPFHMARRLALAELDLSDEQRVAAVTALRVEQRKAQAADVEPLTAQQLAVRAATGAAWDAAGAA